MSVQLRPTFSIPLEHSTAVFMKQLQSWLQRHALTYCGQLRTGHAMISMHESKRHFWSPWLHLEIRGQDPEPRLLEGRFSPHPNIWTAVMFSYLAAAVIAFFSMVMAISQGMVGYWPWAWWGVVACLGVSVALWLVSQFGQSLAAAQMEELKQQIMTLVELDPDELGEAGNRPPI